MKKWLYSLALLAAANPLGLMAQSMVVVEKDGTKHKFNTDYIQEIRFDDDDPQLDEYEFTSLEHNIYGYGNATLTFATADGNVNLVLDAYGSMQARFLESGVYTVDAEEGFYIDPNYSNARVDGLYHGIESGTMTVEKTGTDYSVYLDLVLSGDVVVKGSYHGGLPGYDGIYNFTATKAKYVENNFPIGKVYVTLADEQNYNIEMALDFVTSDTAERGRELPAGVYTYSENGEVGTFGPSSYIQGFKSPYYDRFAPGEGSTVTVTKDGDNYTFDIAFKTGIEGFELNVTYTGTIEKDNSNPQPSDGYAFTTVSPNLYSNGNVELTFGTVDGGVSITLDSYGSATARFLEPGVYTIGADTGFRIDASYSSASVNGAGCGVVTGTMTVEKDGVDYTIAIDVELSDGTFVKGTYQGGLPGYDGIYNFTANQAKYVENDYPMGKIYMTLSDADYNIEMALDFFTSDTAERGRELPAGVYTYSENGEVGTFGPSSYIQGYKRPYYDSFRPAEGSTVTVTKDGDNYTLDIAFKTGVEGFELNVSYVGVIEKVKYDESNAM